MMNLTTKIEIKEEMNENMIATLIEKLRVKI